VSEGREDGGDSTEPDPESIGLALSLDPRLNNLARLVCAALPAAACAIRWQVGGDAGDICAGKPPERDAAARAASSVAVVSAFRKRDNLSSGDNVVSGRLLDRAEIAGLAGGGATLSAERMVAGRYAAGDAVVSVAAVPAPEAPESEAKALLEIVGGAAVREAAALRIAASRNFWRVRASAALRRVADDASRERERVEIADLISELSSLAQPERFRTMGDRIAASVGCDRWLLALRQGETLQIEASAPPLQPRRKPGCSIEFANALRARGTVVHEPGSDSSAGALEVELLGDAWTAIPMHGGAVALGGRLEPAARSKAEATAAAVAPLVRAWIAERELTDHRALVQRMALRMYAAIDDERARIARDLHDDQGQLLAAARLALNGKPEAARAIFKKLEHELRGRTREIRPATLGKLTLAQALEGELARVREAGIAAHLSMSRGVARISHAVQQLCFQVAREALSNAMRHSGASLVTISVERTDTAVRMVVADNGHGLPPARDGRASMGLAGVAERLELMGGNVDVVSDPSGTTLTAEIPETT
jgi:signal transduction histidine kinase